MIKSVTQHSYLGKKPIKQMGRLQNSPSIGWVHPKSTHYARPLAFGAIKNIGKPIQKLIPRPFLQPSSKRQHLKGQSVPSPRHNNQGMIDVLDHPIPSLSQAAYTQNPRSRLCVTTCPQIALHSSTKVVVYRGKERHCCCECLSLPNGLQGPNSKLIQTFLAQQPWLST